MIRIRGFRDVGRDEVQLEDFENEELPPAPGTEFITGSQQVHPREERQSGCRVRGASTHTGAASMAVPFLTYGAVFQKSFRNTAEAVLF